MDDIELKLVQCSADIELLMVQCRPSYLPREFMAITITPVYIPTQGTLSSWTIFAQFAQSAFKSSDS